MEIARRVKKADGRVLVVGGAVRDAWLLMRPQNVLKTSFGVLRRPVEIKDIDMEVYGLNKSALKHLLLKVGRVGRFGTLKDVKGRVVLKEVGKQFGVFNLGGLEIAIPRTDSRTAAGMGRKPHVVSQPYLSFEQASRRRDLTINALAYDPLADQILDVQGGLNDLRRGILRAVDVASFGDDPLRVLRVMQFAGRFGFKIDPATLKLCQSISLKHLAKERVGEEWHKLMLKSPKPSVGLEAGRQLAIFTKLHPALAHMSKTDWNATKKAVDKLAKRPEVLLFAALVSHLKPEAGKKLLQQINLPKREVLAVMTLVELANQARHANLDESIRRSAFELSKVSLTISDLVLLLQASGKGALAKKILSRAKVLHVADQPPKPLLQGKDLLALGVKPGKKMGELLAQAFNQQLKGKFDNAKHEPQKRLALEWVESPLFKRGQP